MGWACSTHGAMRNACILLTFLFPDRKPLDAYLWGHTGKIYRNYREAPHVYCKECLVTLLERHLGNLNCALNTTASTFIMLFDCTKMTS
jgi:hypothetical protein